MKRETSFLLACALLACAAPAAAQELSAAERATALSRVRALAECVEREHTELQTILRLVREAEVQRDGATDRRVRVDAEHTLEALVARAATVEERGRACFGGGALPRPGTEVVVRAPASDPAADAIAERGGTVREVEAGTRLADQLEVVRGEQVDGTGRLPPGTVQAAVRAIAPRLARCHDQFLERGSLAEREVEVSFAVRSAGRPRQVTLERSGFGDAATDRCLRVALEELRFSEAPRGGEAVFAYSLRFGPPRR